MLWQQDAAYRYYRHGPLARTQPGQLNVQGIDYAYTLQGWLKGVNSSQIGKGGSAYYDMGGDDGSSISRTAKDVYSYSLHYYDDAGRSDYRPIGRAVVPAPFSNFEQVGGSVTSPLYNGNIAAMGVQIDYGVGGGGQGTGLREPLLYAYRYDQLNRLVGMQAHRNLVNNQWRPVALDDYREWVSYDANGNIRSYDRNGTTTAYGTPVAGHALEMDRLSYGYTEVSLNGRQVLTSNRLRHVKDAISDANRYTEDIDNQADDNYSYDAIGNLVRDQQGGNEEIRWTVYGKIAGIHKTDGTQVYYSYDASGNRISKTVDRSGSTNPSAGVTTTWYVRDAQGNVLSTYEKRGSSPLEQTELHLYGSSRLGIQRTGGLVVESSLVSLYTYSTETLVRGRKLYELSNHLGNVLATITDKKVLVSDGGSVGGTGGVCANGGLVEVLDVYNRDGALSSYRARQEINFYSAFESGSNDEWEGYIDAGATICDNNNGGGGTGSGMPAGAYYVADLVSATDYAPFGMGLVGRTYNAGAYKYAFNSKERDQDISDDSYDYGMRIHDARLGRFLSVDPITKQYPELTPYQYASNRPIDGIDMDGLEWYKEVLKVLNPMGVAVTVDKDVAKGFVDRAGKFIHGLKDLPKVLDHVMKHTTTALPGGAHLKQQEKKRAEIALGIAQGAIESVKEIGDLAKRAFNGDKKAMGGLMFEAMLFLTPGLEEFAGGKFFGATKVETFAASRIENFITTEEGALFQVEKFKTIIEKGEGIEYQRLLKDPIEAVEYEGAIYILDGHNRLKAFSELGKEAKVTMLSIQDAAARYKTKFGDVIKGIFKNKLKDEK